MERAIPTNNNFDFLRLLFASIVFFVHSYNLTRLEDLDFIRYFLSSTIAVKSFFVISGFLIFMSYEHSKSLENYFMKRVKRLYPAYLTVILLSSLLGVFISKLSFIQYFTSPIFIKYLLSNLIFANFLQPSLPGVFDGNLQNAVNGALWTLKVEVMFYLSVPAFVWLFNKTKQRNLLLIAFYVLSQLYFNYFISRNAYTIAMQLPGQLAYFLGGALLYYNFSLFEKYWKQLSIAGALVFYVINITFLEPIALSVLVVFCAFKIPGLNGIGKFGDFSYGVYICHWPLLQLLISFGLFKYNVYVGMAAAIFLVFCTAFISWNYIEKPFLKKRHDVDTPTSLTQPLVIR